MQRDLLYRHLMKWNNFLIQNFLELGKIRVSEVYRKLRPPVNRSGSMLETPW